MDTRPAYTYDTWVGFPTLIWTLAMAVIRVGPIVGHSQ